MKKVFIIAILALVLTGCGNNSKLAKTCTKSVEDASGLYTLDSKYEVYGSNVVDKIVITETVISDDIDTLKNFEQKYKTLYEDFNKKYGGYTNKVTLEEGRLVSETICDYNKMNLKKYAEDNSSLSKYLTKDNKVDLSGRVTLYEETGSVCK